MLLAPGRLQPERQVDESRTTQTTASRCSDAPARGLRPPIWTSRPDEQRAEPDSLGPEGDGQEGYDRVGQRPAAGCPTAPGDPTGLLRGIGWQVRGHSWVPSVYTSSESQETGTGGRSRRGCSIMIRTRHSVLLIALLCVVAIGMPPGTAAGEPHGRPRADLRTVAAGKAPDRSIVSRTRDGQPEVAVSVELAGEPSGVMRGRLRSAGLDLRGTWRRTIEGYVRPRQLEKLAGTPGVVAVRAIRAPLVDGFVGPAPALHGATAWQQAGFTGEGVKVGILDGRLRRVRCPPGLGASGDGPGAVLPGPGGVVPEAG